MNKRIRLALLLGIAVLSCSSNYLVPNSLKGQGHTPGNRRENKPQFMPVTARAVIKGDVIELEVARTPEQIALGLMFRDDLPVDRGMLFIYEPAAIARFWMKNVSMALDMIFLLEGEITAIAHSVPPCRSAVCPVYGPDSLVDRVIELRAGRAEGLGLAVGDRIRVEFLN